jgi:uncharacterized protein (DUF697 family)
MASRTDSDQQQGERLYHAVERILAAPEEIEHKARELLAKERGKTGASLAPIEERAALAVIRHYSLATAVGGGLTSLPALLPGGGTALALVAGGLADMTLCLKFEVEMILALASLYGHDIRLQQERATCFLLAGITTYQELAGKNAALDIALVEGEALWRYTPRQVGKLVATVFLHLALLAAGRRLLRAIPLAGALIGAGANKLLTQKVGKRALVHLQQLAVQQARAAAGGAAEPGAGQPSEAAPSPATGEEGSPASAGDEEVVDAELAEP